MLKITLDILHSYGQLQNGHTEVANTLIANGAYVNAKNNDGDTALIWAAINGQTQLVNRIKEASYQQYKQELIEYFKSREITLAIAKHSRLGAESPVNVIDQATIKLIIGFACQERIPEIEEKYKDFQDSSDQFRNRLSLERMQRISLASPSNGLQI